MVEHDAATLATRKSPARCAGQRRRARSLLLCGLIWVAGTGFAADDDRLLLGTWDAGDRASQSRYGRLWVSASHLQWSGSRVYPGCRVRYTVAAREMGDSYRDALPGQAGRENDANTGYSVFRLALEQKACAGERSAMQFAISATNPERAELITYDGQSRPVAWGHLERLPAR